MNLLHEVHLYRGWPQGSGPSVVGDLPRHFYILGEGVFKNV